MAIAAIKLDAELPANSLPGGGWQAIRTRKHVGLCGGRQKRPKKTDASPEASTGPADRQVHHQARSLGWSEIMLGCFRDQSGRVAAGGAQVAKRLQDVQAHLTSLSNQLTLRHRRRRSRARCIMVQRLVGEISNS